MTKKTKNSLRFNNLLKCFIDDATGESVYFLTEYRTTSHGLIPNEPDDYVVRFSGDVVEHRVGDDGREVNDTKVGSISGSLVLVGEIWNVGESVHDACDAADDETIRCYAALFDGQDFREDLRLCGFGSDMLVIESLTVLPDHRGNNVGLLAMRDAIRQFGGGCRAAALHVFPLQLGNGSVEKDQERSADRASYMGYADMPKDVSVATKTLKAHYARLGFRDAPGSNDVMFLDLGRKSVPLSKLLAVKARRQSKASKGH